MKLEQSAMARTGREVLPRDPVPVTARRQLSATHARLSRTVEETRPAKTKAKKVFIIGKG